LLTTTQSGVETSVHVDRHPSWCRGAPDAGRARDVSLLEIPAVGWWRSLKIILHRPPNPALSGAVVMHLSVGGTAEKVAATDVSAGQDVVLGPYDVPAGAPVSLSVTPQPGDDSVEPGPGAALHACDPSSADYVADLLIRVDAYMWPSPGRPTDPAGGEPTPSDPSSTPTATPTDPATVPPSSQPQQTASS
jgi:hypothetical protein